MVERKLPNGNTDVMESFQLRFGGSGNFAQEQKGNVSMVDTYVNVPRTGRAEADINRPSDLSLPHLLSLLSCFLCFALYLAGKRVLRLGAWAQSFLSDCETSCVIRTLEQKGFLRIEGFEVCKDGEGWSYGAQGDGFGSFGQCKGVGVGGAGFAPHLMPWAYGKAMGPANGEDSGGAVER